MDKEGPPMSGEVVASSSDVNVQIGGQDEMENKCGGSTGLRRSTLASMTKQRRERFSCADTTISSGSESFIGDKCWLEDPEAWDHFCSVLTSLYALFIIVFAVVVELSQKFTPDEWFSETLFYTYMYGAGVIFLIYCYLFKVHPSWFNRLLNYADKRRWITGIANWYIAKTSHTGEGAGSLYLRLGTLCFGSSGIVLFCLEIFMCLSDRHCFTYQLVNWIFAGLFTFIQMHFIFCNSKIIIISSKNLAKLGTMHLLAVNIWTWLRFVIAKNAALERQQQLRPTFSLLNDSASGFVKNAMTAMRNASSTPFLTSTTNIFTTTSSTMSSVAAATNGPLRFHAFGNATRRLLKNLSRSGGRQPVDNHNFTVALDGVEPMLLRVSSFDYFGDFATLLTTSIVEYSVIGAAIMIVLWRSIDTHHANASATAAMLAAAGHASFGADGERYGKRRHKVRIDCSASSGGLFAGLLFMICALVSIGIHSFFSQHCDSHGALLVFRLSDMALFCFTLIGCSAALYRMRVLRYCRQRSSSTEYLDEILLVIGLIGELIHSSTAVMCWISTQSERTPMEPYMLFVFVTRIVQVVVQAVFILLARRLRSTADTDEKPGKQFVTFLLIANVSLFFFHTLEGMKSIFGNENLNANRRTRPYASLLVGVAPLIVLYRFHSSVCLAEIWKHCYSVKEPSHRGGNLTSLQSQRGSLTSTIMTDPIGLSRTDYYDNGQVYYSSGSGGGSRRPSRQPISFAPQTSIVDN